MYAILTTGSKQKGNNYHNARHCQATMKIIHASHGLYLAAYKGQTAYGYTAAEAIINLLTLLA